MPADVREALASERGAVRRALSLAFEDDPVMAFLFPDAASRRRRLESFYAVTVPLLASHGVVHTVAGLHAAAVWQAPSPPRPHRLARLWTSLRMLLVLRGSVSRGAAAGAALLSAHLREPHWYLAFLGTEPSRQCQGLGAALLAVTLERCDRDGTLAYLESSKPSNIPFYERHGFEVVRELPLPGGPPVWPMLRRPRGSRG